jgi:hypothetical protein
MIRVHGFFLSKWTPDVFQNDIFSRLQHSKDMVLVSYPERVIQGVNPGLENGENKTALAKRVVCFHRITGVPPF